MLVSMSKVSALAVLGATFAGGSLAGFALRGSCGHGPALAAPADLPPPIQGGVLVPTPAPRTPPAPAPAVVGVRAVPTPGAWYRLVAGDTLSEVSRTAYGTTKRVHDIARVNPGLDPRRIPKGTLIYVPKGAESPGSPPAGR